LDYQHEATLRDVNLIPANPSKFAQMTQRFSVCLLLLAPLALGYMNGCDSVESPKPASEQQNSGQKLVELKRQRDDVRYEMQLRQEEMNEMETTAKRPGVVGVSKAWLERHNQLKEEVIRLKVKAHDLDLQIADLSSNQQAP
jgi:hypothetical protein